MLYKLGIAISFIVKDSITKKKLRKVAVDQEYVELAPVLIIVCSNTSRSTNRYGMRGWEFYSVIMALLLQ